jgi:hypothetical protein
MTEDVVKECRIISNKDATITLYLVRTLFDFQAGQTYFAALYCHKNCIKKSNIPGKCNLSDWKKDMDTKFMLNTQLNEEHENVSSALMSNMKLQIFSFAFNEMCLYWNNVDVLKWKRIWDEKQKC